MSEEKPTVYLETSFISYLTGRLSRDLQVATHQTVTRDWWLLRKVNYNLYVSDAVVMEIKAGDIEASNERVDIISSVSVLKETDQITELASDIINRQIIPNKAQTDALHVAYATVNKISYLLTWNCRHIANAEIEKKISEYLRSIGYEAPYLCTPLELMGEL